MERLERMLQCDIIQAIEGGFNGHDIKRDEILKDVNWLIEQVASTEKDVEELDESLHIARVGRRDLVNYAKQLNEKIERYEKALKECIEQDGLMAFLDDNDWAISEDYFVKISKDALYK